jgi:membrane protease YdiL (CAAX protease family)
MPRNKDGNSYFGPSALILLVTVFAIAFVIFNFSNAANVNASYAAVIALQVFIYGASAAIYMSIRSKDLMSKINVRPTSIKNIGITIVVTLIVILVFVVLKFGVFLPYRDYFLFNFYSSNFNIQLNSFSDWLLIIFAFVLLPSLGKEFLFRSIVYSEYKSTGVLCSIIITSLLYSMMHLSFQEFFVHFIASVLWTYLAYITGSFIWPFISHLLCNFYLVFGEKYLWSLSSNPDGSFLFWLITISLLLLSLFILFAILESKYKEWNAKFKTTQPEQKQNLLYNLKVILLSKPVIIDFAIFIIVAMIRLF